MTSLPTLQLLASQFTYLTDVLNSCCYTATEKSRFLDVMKRAIGHSLNALDGYPHLKNTWGQLVQLHTETSKDAKKMAPTWAHTLLQGVKEAMQSVSCRKPQAHAFYQRHDVRELLLQSLSWSARHQQKKLPCTFEAADTLISHLLQGQYGSAIREHILDNGFFTQEHFFVLLLVDIIRQKGSLAAVEQFSHIPPADLQALACTTLDNKDIFNYLSIDGALLPQEHARFMKVASEARFADEKTFSYLREYLLLQCTPCFDNLLHLVLHAQEPNMLDQLKPWIDARLHAQLAEMHALVMCTKWETLVTDFSQQLNSRENEELRYEYLHTVIAHIAEERGPLAIDLAHSFVHPDELDDTLRTILFIYAQRDYKQIFPLLSCIPKKKQAALVHDIAIFYAEHDPKHAFSIVKLLDNLDHAVAVFFTIIEYHGTHVAAAFLTLASKKWQEMFCEHMATILANMQPHDQAFTTATSCLTERPNVTPYEYFPLFQEFDAGQQDFLRAKMVTQHNLSDITLLRIFHLWLALGRDIRTALDLLQLIFDPDLRTAGFSSAIIALCRAGALDQKAAALVSTHFVKDPDLGQLALDRVLQIIEQLVTGALADEMSAKQNGLPVTNTPLAPLACSIIPLLTLTQTSVPRTRQALTRQLARLASIYAPFSSQAALWLLRSSQLEDMDTIRNVTSAIALGYVSECNRERGSIKEILDWIGGLRKLHHDTFDPLFDPLLARLATLIFICDGDMETAMHIVLTHVRSPSVRKQGLMALGEAAIRKSTYPILRASHEEQKQSRAK